MSLFQRVKESFKVLTKQNNQRSIAGLYQSDIYSGEPDFLDRLNSDVLTAASLIFGLTEEQISPMSIYEMVNKDPYFSGLIEQITESVVKSGFYVDVGTNEDGDELGDKTTADNYKKELEKIEYIDIATKIIYGLLGDGGGNILFSTIKTKKGLEFRCDPFLADGYPRVQAFGDNNLRKVTKYDVIDINRRPIWSIDPEKDYYYHMRYNPSGNYLFSSNPAKKAVYWYIFKKYLSGAPLNSFKHGLQEPVIASPDYSALKVLTETMNIGKATANPDSAIKNPFEFLNKQSKLDDEVLRTQVGNARKDNTLIKMHMPYTFQKVGRNNANMQTVELINLCDKQMGFALRTGQALLDARYSKYSNAEEEEDNWKSLVVSPIKKRIEFIAENFVLPAIDPNYDKNIYKVCFGRDPNAEQIEIFKAKTDRNESVARILAQLSTIKGYTYNLRNNEIEKVEEQAPNIAPLPQIPVLTQPEAIQETLGTDRAEPKNETPAEKGIKSKEGIRFNEIVGNAIGRQVRNYAETLKKKDSVKQAIKDLDKDFKPISNYGLNVNVYKNHLLKIVNNAITEDKKAVNEREEVPQEVVRLMDAKAQMMVKGMDTLTTEQKKLIKDFYGRDYKGYAGFDAETTDQINTLLRENLNKEVKDVVSQLLDMIPELSEGRATRIINTEIAQDIEASREIFYTERNYNEHSWVTVKDERVREGHRLNEAQGWIPIDQDFQSGAHSPSEEIECRCTKRFRKI